MKKKAPPQVCTMIANLDRMLGQLTAYGASSRLAKARGDSSLAIRSLGRRGHLQKSGSGFIRYAHAHFGVDREAQLRPHHGQAWAFSTDAPTTQKTRVEDLRWLQRAYREVMGLQLELIPPDVHVRLEKDDIFGTGQFSPEEEAAIIEFARSSRNPHLGDAMEYGSAIGVRPAEIVATKVRDYDASAGVLHVPAIKWAHPRDVEVPPQLQPGFGELIQGRAPNDRLYLGVSVRGLERIVAEANSALHLPPGDDGTPRTPMAFRGAFATELLGRYLAAGMDEGDARREVAKQMGHGNPEIHPRLDVGKDHYLRKGDLGVRMRDHR